MSAFTPAPAGPAGGSAAECIVIAGEDAEIDVLGLTGGRSASYSHVAGLSLAELSGMAASSSRMTLVAPRASLRDPHTLACVAAVAALGGGAAAAVVVDAADAASALGAAAPDAAVRVALAVTALEAVSAESLKLAASLTAATVLVLGGGGREHAIAVALGASPSVARVLVAPGNGGTALHPSIANVPAAELDTSSSAAVAAYATAHGVALVVVGPEAPLIAGVADALAAAGIKCFGPTAAAAKLEASKAFSKDFMKANGIRTARYENFTDAAKAEAYVERTLPLLLLLQRRCRQTNSPRLLPGTSAAPPSRSSSRPPASPPARACSSRRGRPRRSRRCGR